MSSLSPSAKAIAALVKERFGIIAPGMPFSVLTMSKAAKNALQASAVSAANRAVSDAIAQAKLEQPALTNVAELLAAVSAILAASASSVTPIYDVPAAPAAPAVPDVPAAPAAPAAPAPAPAPAPVSPGGGGGGGGSDPLAAARQNLALGYEILELKRLLQEQERLNTVAGDRAAQAAEQIDRLQDEIEEHKETITMGAAAVSELRAEVDRLAADANYGVPLFVKTRDERDQLLIELDTLKARLAKLESPVTLKARLAELLSRQCGSRFGLGSLLWVLRNQYGFKPTEIDLVALIKELGHTVTDKLVEGKTKYNVELALGNRTPKSMPVCWKNIGGKCSKPDCKYAHPELPTNSGGGADAATM
jgi:hypothetical protein